MKKLMFSLVSVYIVGSSFLSNNFNNGDDKPVSHKTESKEENISTIDAVYSKIDFSNSNELSRSVFEKAYLGFQNLKNAGKIDESSNLLTICDFSLSSNVKRLWVINVNTGKIIFNSLVAHGKNTGDEYAQNFSNLLSSLQSSLGFYITDTTYNGSNGFSLRLEGQDDGYNDAAYERAIVMHGADYVNENFAIKHKRIGRSWGCPAVPRALAYPIINTIKGRNVLFIYYPDQKYLASSKWLKPNTPDILLDQDSLKRTIANN